MAFVSYDSYKNRIEKLAKVKNFVSKYKFLFIGVLAVIIGGISALLATKGMITTDMSLTSSTFTYGDPFTPSAASSFLSDVSYEYTVQGKDEWSTEKPRKVGKYSVRAVTDKVIGKGYGKPVDFEILPKPVTFTFGNETSLRYGDKPVNYNISDLIAGDRIDKNGADFDYVYHDQAEDISEWTVDVTVGAGSVKIVDKSGADFSDCYLYDTAEKTFTLTRRPISVVLQNSSDTYRGAEISYKGELFAPDLAEGDGIIFETEITKDGSPAKLLNAGVYALSVKENSVKIFKGSEEVTKRYDIGTPVNGRFTVNQKTLSISTQSGNKTYDGTALSREGGTPDGIISGHTLLPTGTVPSITDVGTVQNVQTFDILDGSGENVSANYDYQNNYKYGNLTVTRRQLTITTAGGGWEYDGTAHPVTDCTANGFADGQQLANIYYASESMIDVDDSGKNSLSYSIVWGQSGLPVDINNYEITENYGDIKITARPIKVTTEGAGRPYNGDRLTCENYSVTYAGEKAGQTEAFINYGESLSVVGSLPYVINVGTKENAINFAVPNNNYYIKETVNGTLQITQAEITVTLEDISGVAYGDKLPEPAYTISGEGIVGGNLFGGDTFKPAFKYQNGLSPTSYEAGKTYEVSLDTANCTFTYGNGEPVTQPNYIINSNKSNLTIGKRAITVCLNDTQVVYGNSVVYTGGNEAVDYIVDGQTVRVDATNVDFDISSDMPDARTYRGVISCLASAIKIYDGGTEVTSNYTVTVQNSSLTVTPRPITVHAKDMPDIIYGEEIDYTAVHGGGYKSITGDYGLASGETLTVNRVSYLNVKGETVDPNDNPDRGTYKIKPSSITIKKANGDDSSIRGNYDITPADDGVLTIVARPITIKSATDLDLIYDGTPQFRTGNEVTSALDKLSDHRIEVTYYKTVTNVSEGTVQNELKYVIKDSFNNVVTDNYAIEDDFGWLKVNPRPITVELFSYNVTYGEDYSYRAGTGNYENDPDLVTGETLEVLNVTYEFGTIQYPDVRDTAYWVKSDTFKVTKAGGAVSTGNYEITPVDGSLTIDKRNITVQLISYSATYGESYAYKTGAGNYENTPDLVTGETLEITGVEYEFENEQYPEVNDGGYWVRKAGYEITKNGADGKGNYEVEWVDGTLTITKRTITVTLNNIATVIYGEAVTYVKGGEKVENTIGVCTVDFDTANLKFIPADDVSVGTRNDIIDGATYKYPDAGAYKFDCDGNDITVYKGGVNVSHNYTVNVVSGRLQINKRAITVKASSYEKVYGENFNYSASGKPNYEKITKGSLAVFDGVEETLVISVNSLEFDGYVKRDVGTYPVHPDGYKITKTDGTTDSSENYTVEFEDGTLKITQKQIEVELINKRFEYGEDDHSKKTYAQLYAEEIKEVTISPAETLKLTFGFTDADENPVDPRNAGDYGVVITNGETDNYIIKPKSEVKLSINPRQIHPIPYAKTEVYGATEFNYPSVGANASTNYDDEYGYYYNLPAYNEKIEILISYDLGGQEIPSVGTYDALCIGARVLYSDGTSEDGELSLSNGVVTTQNYQIFCESYNFADKLEIIKREIKVTLNEMPDAVYTGEDIQYVGGGETADNLVNGHYLEVDPEGVDFDGIDGAIFPNVGDYTISSNENFIRIYFKDENGEKTYVTSNYDVTEVINGTLTINALKITVTLHDLASIVYGTATPVPEISGTVNGDKITGEFIYMYADHSAYISPEWLAGGENRYLPAGDYLVYLDLDNYSIEYTNGAPSTVQNYEIESDDVIPANLEVTKRNLIITLKDFEREYGQNNSDTLTWQKKGNPTRLASISDMDIGDLVTIHNMADGDGVNSLTLSVYELGTDTGAECKNAGLYSVGLSGLIMHFSDGLVQASDNYQYPFPEKAILEITQKSLTLEVGEKKAIYGSDSFTLEWWEYSRGGLPFNEVVKVSSFALKDVIEYPADVGTYDLDPKVFTATVAGGSADNYDITISGSLKIEQREITVNLHNNEVYYGDDYDYLTVTGGTYIDVAGLVSVDDKTETLEITLVDYGFDEGVFPNASETPYTVKNLECKITKVDGTTDSTGNYSVKWMGGNLTVKPRPVTVTLLSVEDIIYGKDLPVPEYAVEGYGVEGGLIGDDKFCPAYSWRQCNDDDLVYQYVAYGYGEALRGNVGKYGIVLYEVGSYFTDANDNKTQNYELILNEPLEELTFNITPRPITITLKDFSREYGELNCSWIFWRKGTSADHQNIAGELEEFMSITGELAPGEEIKSFDLVGYGSSAHAVFKNVGTYELSVGSIGIGYEWADTIYDDDLGNIGNYEISEDSVLTATLTIIRKDLTVDLGDYSFTYGEDEEFRENFAVTTTEGLAFNESLSITDFFALKGEEKVEGRLNADGYTLGANDYAAVISDKDGEPITDGYKNYDITFEGTLTVIKRTVTVTLNDMPDFVYGEEIVYENGDEAADNLLTGHYVYVDPGIVNFGKENDCPSVGTYDISANKDNIRIYFDTEDGETVDVTDNYDIEVENATLTINARKITLTLQDYAEAIVYGYEIPFPVISGTVNGDTVTGGLIYKNTETEAEYNSADLVNNKHLPAGEYLVYLDLDNYTFTYTNGASADTTNYEIEENGVIPASLEISKRPITVTLKDFEREYGELDSQGLLVWQRNLSLVDTYRIRGELEEFMSVEGELAPGEEIKLFALGRGASAIGVNFKNVRTYDLRIRSIGITYDWEGNGNSFDIYDDQNGDVSNYQVTVVETGTLTITPKDLTVNLGDYSFTYGEEETFRENFAFTTGADLAFEETLSLTTFFALKDEEKVEDRLNAGDYTLGANDYAAVISDKDGEPITEGYKNYNITFEGTLTVNGKTVNIELLTFEKEDKTPYYYGDGGLLVYSTDKGNYANVPELAYGEQLKIAISWLYGGEGVDAPKNAGIYKYQIDTANSTVYDKDGNEIENGIYNYDFVYELGEVEIEAIQLRLSWNEQYIDYGDDLPYVPYELVERPEFSSFAKYEGETLKLNVVYYDWNEYAYGRKVEVIPEEAGDYIYSTTKYKTYDADGNEHTAQNYVLAEVWEGALYISARKITVTTKDLPDVIYGDQAVEYPVKTNNHGDVGGKGLVAEQYLTITSVEYYDEEGNLIDGVPTEVGTYYIVPTGVEIRGANGLIDIDRNYEISYPEIPDGLSDCGTVRILAVKLLLETNSHAEWIYDGDEHFDKGYTLWLLDDDGNKVHVFDLPDGETVITGDYTIVKNACKNVDNVVELTFPNYDIVQTVWGKLTVQQREITIESATNRTFIYDGKAHSDENYEITSETKLVEGHSITVSRPAKVTEVTEGEVDNTLTYTIIDTTVDENDVDRIVTENYKINKVNGKLKVNPRPITLKSATNLNNWIYNGGDYFDVGFEQITEDGAYTLVDGHIVTVVGKTTVRNVMQGEVTNVLTYNVVDESGNDYTDNYLINPINGKIKVNPAHITIVLNNYPDLLYSDTLYPDGYDNYDLEKSTPLVDGERLKVAVKYKDAEGNEVTPESVGTYTVVLDLDNCFVQIPLTTANGFGNYVVDNPETEGEITVSPKPITVELEDITNVYGEEFKAYPTGSYQIVDDGLVDPDTLRVYVRYFKGKNEVTIDERTPADAYTVAIDYCAVNGVNYYRDGNDSVIECGNYIITFVNSKLTVNPRPIFVVTGSKEKEGYYDGTSISCTEIERVYYKDNDGNDGIAEWDNVEDVLSYVANSANSLTNAGSVDNEAQFESISNNYEIAYTVKGTLTIKQRPITIELLQIGNQTYGTRLTYPDGTEEPNFNYTGDSECELVSGEKLLVAVKYKGSDGNLADPKNADTYSYEFDLDGSSVTGSIGGAGIENYDITCTDSKYAKVNKLTVTVNLQQWDTVYYNGEYHEYDGGITTEFAYGETMELAVDYYSVKDGVETLLVNTSPRNAGNYLAKYNEANSRIGGNAPDVNYEIIISPEDGISFTILAKNITISMDTETRPYNGEVYDYVSENANFGITGAVAGETVVPAIGCYADEELTQSVAPKNAGTYYIAYGNSFTVTGSNDVVENYVLTNPDVRCELIITKRQVTVTVHDRTIERPTEVIDPVADESYDHKSTGGEFGFTAADLSELTLVYSYAYAGKDGKAEPVAVTLEEVRQTGFYKVKLSFEGEESVLENYEIDCVVGTLEITAIQVEIVPEFNGGNFVYNGGQISLDGFGFKHYHKDHRPDLGFAEEDVPKYNVEDAPSYKLLFTRNGVSSYDAPVDAGIYTVKFVFEGIDPEEYTIYNDDTLTITIAPRKIKAVLDYDASQYADITYNYDLLPTSSISVTDTDETGTEKGILACDDGLEIDWYFFNNALGREVEYNYAGNYAIRFRLNKTNGNYEIVNFVYADAFTVKKATLYVTPKSLNADYEYEGQTLALAGDDYNIRSGVLYNGDTLTITGSGVLKTSRSMPVTISKVEIVNGILDLTSSYDVHYSYEEGSPVPVSEFTATLSFNPVKIYYTQTVLDDEHRFFEYTGQPHDLGVDRSNLQSYVQISNAGDFVGTYRLQYVLVTVVSVREYQKWIQIIVFDKDNNNVTSLYDFRLTNAEQSKVVVKGYDLNLNVSISDDDLADAWAKRDDASDNTLKASTLYSGYYVLNSGYTVTGFDEDSHECEILVREEGGELVLKVIVFEDSTYGRTEKGIIYTLNLTTELTNSITLTRIGLILASISTN